MNMEAMGIFDSSAQLNSEEKNMPEPFGTESQFGLNRSRNTQNN